MDFQRKLRHTPILRQTMQDFVQSKKALFAFAQRSGAMKAPVGLLSDRTVLRKQDGGASPRQVRVCAAKWSNESPSGAFKRQNGLA